MSHLLIHDGLNVTSIHCEAVKANRRGDYEHSREEGEIVLIMAAQADDLAVAGEEEKVEKLCLALNKDFPRRYTFGQDLDGCSLNSA